MSLGTVCVKEEAVCVKTEPVCEDSRVSAAAAQAGLYTDHQIKDELVLGPEVWHKPKVLTVQAGATPPAPGVGRPCSVRLERVLVSVRGRLGRRTNTPRPHNADTRPRQRSQCHHCQKLFTNKSVLTRHLRIHSPIKPSSDLIRKDFACKFCSSRFETKINVINHEKSEHSVKYYECSECAFTTIYKKCLQIHVKKHIANKFKCNHCSYTGRNKRAVLHHQTTHTGAHSKCSHCDYRSSRTGNLQRHQRIHTNEKPYTCNYCEFKCSHSESLRRHQKIHASIKSYKCGRCDYETNKKTHLKIHQKIHTIIKYFKCNRCDYKTIKKTLLIYHQKIHIVDNKLFKCMYCDYICSNKALLRRHDRMHTGEKPYECNHCNYKSTQKSHLQRHQKVHNDKIKNPFKCSYRRSQQQLAMSCCVRLERLRSDAGLRSVPVEEKPYVCEECTGRFTSKSLLEKHIQQTHLSGDGKQHVCGSSTLKTKYLKLKHEKSRHSFKSSENRAISKDNLARNLVNRRNPSSSSRHKHVIVRHKIKTAGKQLKCSHCNYKCSRKYNLQRHQRKHTGAKPYKCNYCDFKSSRIESLRRHQMIHEGQELGSLQT